MKTLVHDLVGFKFGKLTAVKRADVKSKRGVYWLCKCDCGKEIVVRSDALRMGKTRSCGCEKSLVGMKFGELTVLDKAETRKDHHTRWLCRCECGNVKIMLREKLTKRENRGCRCHKNKDLIGLKFGKATVIDRVGIDKHRNTLWKCVCDDGTKIIVRASQLHRYEKKDRVISA